MSKETYDTNIFISRKRKGESLPDSFYMSVVVLQELVVGAQDITEVKVLNAARKEYEKAGRLMVPTAEDWWEVGRIIYLLQHGQKAGNKGLTPKISAKEKYRITNDVFIARTARRAGVTVVTDNTADFELIRPYCAVKTVSAREYFGS